MPEVTKRIRRPNGTFAPGPHKTDEREIVLDYLRTKTKWQGGCLIPNQSQSHRPITWVNGKMMRIAPLILKLRGDKKGYALHHCDNGMCVRPSHIYSGNQQQNMDDFWSRQRDRGKRG